MLLFPLVKKRRQQFVLTYRTSSLDGVNRTEYTFSSLSLGDASAGRVVVVGLTAVAAAARTISGVTAGGVSLTERETQTTGTWVAAALYSGTVPTGTTGDIVVTFNNGVINCGVSVWTMTGLASTTPVDTKADGAVPLTQTVTYTAGGGVVAVAINGSASSSTATWTNIAEKHDALMDNYTHTAASDTFASGSSVEITAAFSSTAANPAMVAASFF